MGGVVGRDGWAVFVPGQAATGGSKKAFWSWQRGGVVVMDDCARNGAWREWVGACVGDFLRREGLGMFERGTAIGVRVLFLLERPGSHFGRGGVVRKGAPQWHATRPDCTKLWRAAEDAMTGVAWYDDGQVVTQEVSKVWTVGGTDGMLVAVKEWKGLRDGIDFAGEVYDWVAARGESDGGRGDLDGRTGAAAEGAADGGGTGGGGGECVGGALPGCGGGAAVQEYWM